MAKVKVEHRTMVYPMPAFLIGAMVDGKPNFMTAAWSGIAGGQPPVITVGINHSRYTLTGIHQNGTFSVNVPSTDIAAETDYCGIESGRKVDKAAVCGFKVFSGQLETAPMIEQCPVNLECKVMHMLDVGSHVLVVGEIKETYFSEECLTNGVPDVEKIKPFAFNPRPSGDYQAFGEVIGKAFGMGLKFRK